MNKKRIHFSIDAGFDSVKVILNGRAYKFPFNVIKTDESKFADSFGKTDDFILFENEKHDTWRVGQYARSLIFENKEQANLAVEMKEFYSENRFATKEFRIGILTSIGFGINKLIEKKELDINSLDEYEINLIISLPHSIKDSYAKSIKEELGQTHSFNLTLGKNSPISLKFTIEPDNIQVCSQVIASIIGETSDDNGNIDMNRYNLLMNGPTLALDGGYKTFGIVRIGKGGIVDNNKAESNTDYNMENVNKKVAEYFNEKGRGDIKAFTVEYLENSSSDDEDNNIRCIVNNDGQQQVETINLNTIKEEKIKEVANDFIKYLNGKFNNMLDCKYVLMTGGTGCQFYKHFKEYYIDQLKMFTEDTLILIKPSYNGVEFSGEYAIAVGAYKALMGMLAYKDQQDNE